jgi:hypothetical protein
MQNLVEPVTEISRAIEAVLGRSKWNVMVIVGILWGAWGGFMIFPVLRAYSC